MTLEQFMAVKWRAHLVRVAGASIVFYGVMRLIGLDVSPLFAAGVMAVGESLNLLVERHYLRRTQGTDEAAHP